MHPSILGAGLLAAATLCHGAPPACPAQGAPVAEHFIAASCPDCWSADAGAPPDAWRFDWITPAADDDPLAAAALPDATERLLRLGGAATGERSQAARSLRGLDLKVGAGLPWHGYFGLQMTLHTRGKFSLPAGATGWLALVELLPPGSEVNTGPRALVRSVAGPLPLDGAGRAEGLTHLRALRWPAGAKPERLQARGWIEAADGSLLAVAAQRCP